MKPEQVIIKNGKISASINLPALSGIIENKTSGDAWSFDILKNMKYIKKGEEFYTEGVEIGKCAQINSGAGGVEASVRIGNSEFLMKIWMDEKLPDVVFEIIPLDTEDDSIKRLCFPGPILPLNDSIKELILPSMSTQGLSHKPKPEESWSKEFDLWDWGLNMPIWGTSCSTGEVLTIIETPDDCGMILDKQGWGSLKVEPYWLPALGKFSYARRMTVSFINSTSYVDMAKRYRRYLINKGRFKTLKQKIEERPAVAKMMGAPYVYLGYQSMNEKLVLRIIDGMKSMGYEHCLFGPLRINNWNPGWLNDYAPTMKQDFSVYRYAEKAGYLPYTWEWLEDMLEENENYSEDLVQTGNDGKILNGWGNRDYRYRLLCSKTILDTYKKLSDEIKDVPALHMDVTTQIPVMECYSKSHPATRTQDIAYKKERIKGYISAGKVVGSEGGYDWAFDEYDFCSTNPRVKSLVNSDKLYIPAPNRLIPFLSLVFHDSVIAYMYEQDTYMRNRNDMAQWFHGIKVEGDDFEYKDKILFDMMAGNPPTLGPAGSLQTTFALQAKNPLITGWTDFNDPRVQKTLQDALPVAKFHERIGLQEMLEQKYLDDKMLVSRTVFEDGTTVYVNFDSEPHDVDSGKVLGAGDYMIV